LPGRLSRAERSGAGRTRGDRLRLRPRARVQQAALLLGDARGEDDVPEPVGEAVAHVAALRAVMVEVMALDVAEIRVVEVVEVHGVMDPLLHDVALQQARDQHRHRPDGEEGGDGHECDREGKRVHDAAVDVLAVPGPLVVLPVQMVEALVQEVLYDARTVRETAVQQVAMDGVLEQRPGRYATEEEPRYRQAVRGAE